MVLEFPLSAAASVDALREGGVSFFVRPRGGLEDGDGCWLFCLCFVLGLCEHLFHQEVDRALALCGFADFCGWGEGA
jgi:hypothetical protein